MGTDWKPCVAYRRRHQWGERGFGHDQITGQHIGPDERICLYCNRRQVAIDSKRTHIGYAYGEPVPNSARWVYREEAPGALMEGGHRNEPH